VCVCVCVYVCMGVCVVQIALLSERSYIFESYLI